ncbi:MULTISPECIES: YgjV family protein [Shewanella]|uniref:YgjV family protein n=1 Tax=Shewanella litorisediminis TaxID=1173586 RepID=A0ABX7G2N4_9GAMM|nr:MULTISPECIES: YgjV family protein [Shewanella]MCL2918579.1 YgjV family protein [Shewanella litorisediminis]QRH01403.1 YgjV family protein [Shewanella litorisediminis]QYJ74949.1 YgjV family protein [Shewanella sp. FJAT-52076]QYK04819.1 YgjV family protein [Shewanella zhangzhouensis]
MEALNMTEIVGYMASVMVAISLMMKDIIWLRWLNFVGCSLFVAYGVAITAWPVAGMNAFVACINIYHLFKIYRAKTQKPVVA